MGGRLLNGFLLLALMASLGFIWVRRADPTQPNVEVLPEMVHSAAYDAYAPNPNFPDGKTLQAPVPGTVPRGYLPLRYGTTPEDAVRAGLELTNPFPPDDSPALQRGSVVFANFCSPCHGLSGRGDGAVALRGYPPPPSLLVEHAVNMKDGQMFHVLSFGQANMPPYDAQLTREDRWKAVLYVRSLQSQAAKQAAESPLPAGDSLTSPPSGAAAPPPAAPASQEGNP